MIREILENIQNNLDVRKNLIALKNEIKEVAGKHALLYAIGNELQMFYDLLKEEDPKIRKNVATILGKLGVQESLNHLFQAYEKEQTLFVKSSYLSAMKELDYRKYLENFKERLHLLKTSTPEEGNEKHILEEIKLLQEMIFMMEGVPKHTFCGYNKLSKVILLTNRNYREITLEQLKSHRGKVFNAGVMIKTADLEDVLSVRTFSELLFVLDDKSVLEVKEEVGMDELARHLAKQIGESSVVSFLEERHKENGPFYFRIECKNKMDLKQKSAFTKKLAAYIEKETENKLENSTSHYEVEFRLIQNKDGNFNFLIKLFTLKDPRFAYRKQALSTSIQPVNGALVMELAKDYLKPGSQVLDPFCGVGTMLVERAKFMETGDLYGIDLFGKGIEAARSNTELANIKANYINRDFFDFTHEYLFDEVISNLPRVIGKKTRQEITSLYRRFWEKIEEHLKPEGVMVLYCYDRDIFKETLPKSKYCIKEEFEISKKEGAYCFVVQFCNAC